MHQETRNFEKINSEKYYKNLALQKISWVIKLNKKFSAGENFLNGFERSKNVQEQNVQNHLSKGYRIPRNISENFKNCIGKFRKPFQKISEDFEKYFRHFREVISENFEN